MTAEELQADLKRMRERAGLSKREMSAKMGFSASWAGKVEAGKLGVQVPEITKWAEICGYSTSLKFEHVVYPNRGKDYVSIDHMPPSAGRQIVQKLYVTGINVKEILATLQVLYDTKVIPDDPDPYGIITILDDDEGLIMEAAGESP